MKKEIEQYAERLRILTEFMEKYGLQESQVMSVLLHKTSVTFWKQDMENVGELFGRDGWTRVLPYARAERYNWEKTVDGVMVCLLSAEDAPKPVVLPVTAKDWPMQLEDAK